jgi:endoglucanase
MYLKDVRSVFAAALLAVGLEAGCQADSPSAWRQVARMGTGINLGNTFDAPDGEGTWCRQPAQPAFFDDFKAAGFKHVRLPVTWEKHMQETAPFTVDPKFLGRIAEVVGWATQRGLVVVLNAHHEEWFKRDPGAQMERLEALWRQLAIRFKDVPDDLLVFEVLNESDAKHITAAQTTEMNARILRVIRETNPTRCVIIGGVGDNADCLARDLKVPDDPYIIATYHCYDPWFFACGEPRNAAEAVWGSDAQKADYLRTMDLLKQWSESHKVPVYLGEWGTSIKCDPKSRQEYYRFVPAQAAARGFSNAIWDDGGDMWIYDRGTHRWNTDILQAVFPVAPATTPSMK